MTEIQLVGIEMGAKRTLRVFGYRVGDESKKTVEVVLDEATATELVLMTEREGSFPIIEVPDKRWSFCLDTGNIPMLHHRKGPA